MLVYIKKVHAYIESFPERLYPFKSEIEGRFVRGRESYMDEMSKAFEKYGPHRLGYRLTFYRATFHFAGSILFIILSALVAQKLFGSEIALYVLVGVAIAVMTFQEFYLHPKNFGQLKKKGIIDWLTWVVPMLAYLSLH